MYFPQSANTANLFRGLKTPCEVQKKQNNIPRSKSITQSAQTTRVFLVLPAKSTARNTQKI